MYPVANKLRRFFVRFWIETVLLAAVGILWLLIRPELQSESYADTPFRNTDYPNTYIAHIHLDLTSPNQYVRLTWTGPEAASQDIGPFRSTPGAGWGTNDCNDVVESNCPGSRCTPKGLRRVEGLDIGMNSHPECRYLTYIDKRRAISFHSHPLRPPYPASEGCVRLEPFAARLIHDNSIVGKTEILIDGTWTNPKALRNSK